MTAGAATGETMQLWFLGTRTYLHSTTLFDALSPRIAGAERISLRMARLVPSDRIRVDSLADHAQDAPSYAATLHWLRDGDRHAIGVAELPPSHAPSRKPFDEGAIVRRAQFDARTANCGFDAAAGFIQTLVALNKALLQRVVQPRSEGQWLFARLELDRYVGAWSALSLTYRSQIGVSIVSSAISVDGRAAGTLLFSWRDQ